jgi:hypothetical protein
MIETPSQALEGRVSGSSFADIAAQLAASLTAPEQRNV